MFNSTPFFKRDFPTQKQVDRAGIDMLLVGDSVGMVVHGHDTTLPVTLEDMLLHCKAVSRGAQRAFVIADLPFGTYEADAREAVHAAVRLLKEGHVDAVKLEGVCFGSRTHSFIMELHGAATALLPSKETLSHHPACHHPAQHSSSVAARVHGTTTGGGPSRVRAAAALVDAGIAVMGHCGLLPQSISALGGFRPQGQRADGALQVLRQAKALEAAGCMGVVLECVPPVVGAMVTAELGIPTIGIGAGPSTSGQVLVYHDLLGMMTHPHYTAVTPKFCKRYADVGTSIHSALQQYAIEVQEGSFPGKTHSPYKYVHCVVPCTYLVWCCSAYQSCVHFHQTTRQLLSSCVGPSMCHVYRCIHHNIHHQHHRMAPGEAQSLQRYLREEGCTAGLQAVEAMEAG